MSEILRFENISLNTEKKNLFNFSLVIKQGDFFLVNGKNAVGKSLLLKLLFLKILPSNGNIYLYGKKIDNNDAKNLIKADGNDNAIHSSGKKIYADQILYYRNKNLIIFNPFPIPLRL